MLLLIYSNKLLPMLLVAPHGDLQAVFLIRKSELQKCNFTVTVESMLVTVIIQVVKSGAVFL